MYTNKELINLLKKSLPAQFDVMARLKVSYRPYLTPFNELLKIIPDNSSVFDIGCGNGAFLLLVNQLKKNVRTAGVEISEFLIANAKQLLQNVNKNCELSVFDGVNIPDLGNYDYVFMIDVLHHIPVAIRPAFFSSIRNTMKQGAVLILKDIDASHGLLTLCNKIHDLVISREIGHEISRDSAEKLLEQYNFSIQSSEYKRMLWYPHYTIIAKTPNH